MRPQMDPGRMAMKCWAVSLVMLFTRVSPRTVTSPPPAMPVPGPLT